MNRKYKLFVLSSLCSLYSCSELYSQEPCNSGPQTGQRCGPYAALIATGPERGQSYCYICETQKYAIRGVPLGIFEDPLGPPSYRLAKDAEVTVLMFVKQKVVANFALRSGELNDDKIKEVMNSLYRIVGEKK